MINSRDNERVKRWAKLSQDARFRRKERRALIEGPHLLEALRGAGLKPVCTIVSESRAGDYDGIVVSDAVFRSIVDAETPQGVAAEIEIPDIRARSDGNCVFLEGIQDAGNAGAIIRSAAAFGVASVVLDQSCADPWSPKVLRAGTGGHFALAIRQVADLQKELATFSGKLLCTVSKNGIELRKADLSGILGWVFGSEGKGLSAAALREADLKVTIPIMPGTESLNVAATAAICFYVSSKPGAGS